MTGKVKSETVSYKDGEQNFEGILYYDSTLEGNRPGIVVVHEWMGIGEHVKRRCQMLAELGYVAFAADIYGKGNSPSSREEAMALVKKFRGDRALLRKRANLAVDVLRNHSLANARKLAAIGYCFGGGTALALARSGAALNGVVSFHGNLDTPKPEDTSNFKGKILVCHGADDPTIPMDKVLAFHEEMKNAGVNYEVDIYGGAVHAFTNKDAGNDPSSGKAYNPQADARSWKRMKDFFEEIFDGGY